MYTQFSDYINTNTLTCPMFESTELMGQLFSQLNRPVKERSNFGMSQDWRWLRFNKGSNGYEEFAKQNTRSDLPGDCL